MVLRCVSLLVKTSVFKGCLAPYQFRKEIVVVSSYLLIRYRERGLYQLTVLSYGSFSTFKELKIHSLMSIDKLFEWLFTFLSNYRDTNIYICTISSIKCLNEILFYSRYVKLQLKQQPYLFCIIPLLKGSNPTGSFCFWFSCRFSKLTCRSKYLMLLST